jgi:signal transduction histidine kinase
MTQGTSPHGGRLSGHWTGTGHESRDGAWRDRSAGSDRRIGWARAIEGAAPLQLLALSAGAGLVLGLLLNPIWRSGAGGGTGGAAALHLVVVIAICTAAAAMTLRLGERIAGPAPRQDRQIQRDSEAPSRLLAQMHHELRTPLNAMIGFSEVMLRELHGPLGHARYHEYAAHISESGGRLLKASEDAIAVAATMSSLVADRRVLLRDRLPAAALLKEAWEALGVPGRDLRLDTHGCAGVEIDCDRQATGQALRHLLGEAAARTPAGGAIAARGSRRQIEIAVTAAAATGDAAPRADHAGCGDGLRLILAHSLIEMQGGTLSLGGELQAEGWTARIAFPGTDCPRQPPQRPPCASSGARRLACLVRPAGSAGGAAIRASAGSRAAPPA